MASRETLRALEEHSSYLDSIASQTRSLAEAIAELVAARAAVEKKASDIEERLSASLARPENAPLREICEAEKVAQKLASIPSETRDELANLRTQVSALTGERDELRDQVPALMLECDRVRAQVADLETRLEELKKIHQSELQTKEREYYERHAELNKILQHEKDELVKMTTKFEDAVLGHEATRKQLETGKQVYADTYKAFELEKRRNAETDKELEDAKRERAKVTQALQDKNRLHAEAVHALQEEKRARAVANKALDDERREHAKSIHAFKYEKLERDIAAKSFEDEKRAHAVTTQALDDEQRQHAATIQALEDERRAHVDTNWHVADAEQRSVNTEKALQNAKQKHAEAAQALEKELRKHAKLIISLTNERRGLAESNRALQVEKRSHAETRMALAQSTRALDQEKQKSAETSSREGEKYTDLLKQYDALRAVHRELQNEHEELQDNMTQAVVTFRTRCKLEAHASNPLAGSSSISSISQSNTGHCVSQRTSSTSEVAWLDCYVVQMPRSRKDVLAALPSLEVTLPLGYDTVNFSRPLLKTLLGGNNGFTIVRIADTATDLALKWKINGFVYASIDNPWCPVVPGDHGYMHVGFGSDKNAFDTPETQHVFVGGGRDKRYRYCGKYELTRVDPLNVNEWMALPERVNQKLVQASQKKGKPQQPDIIVRKRFDVGALKVPCVLMQFLEFNVDFWKELVTLTQDADVPTVQTSMSKRKRGQSQEVDDHSDAGDDLEHETSARKSARR